MWKWLSPFSSATISSLVQRRSTRPNGRAFIPTRPAGRFSAIHIGWLWLPYVRWVAMVRILRLQVQHQKIRSPDPVNATRIAHKSLLDSPHRLAEPICALPKGGDPGSLKPLLTRLRLLSWLSLCHRSICLSSCKQAGQSTSCQTARAPSSTILSAQLHLEAVRHRTAGVAAGGHGPGSGHTRKVGLTIAALMADSGARRLRACGGGSEPDDQRPAVQRPRRSVDNNLSCKFCVASC